MRLLLESVLNAIDQNGIYIENRQVKNDLKNNVSRIIKNMNNHEPSWAINQIYDISLASLGTKRTYALLSKMYTDYGSELTDYENQVYTNYVKSLEDTLRASGIDLNDLQRHLRLQPEKERMYLRDRKEERRLFDEKNPNNSYAGSDMVASINMPGRGPIVFGELSNISYSLLREKVPVRSLGRVSMKGYTRGMRTITGILSFTVFDESIVYRCIEELKQTGYRMLMDEMPLFDITITMANEFGSRSKLNIYGVSTYTEGMVMSVQDMLIQNVYEFYALDIDPIAKAE